MTREAACALICGRCRAGQVAVQFNGGEYFYHGNPMVRCDASALWAAPTW